jgi:pimeloyl-ACP methyl ester carboxylesterase
MRILSLALIAAALGAQEPPQEPKVSVSEAGIKYLYLAAGPDKAPLLFLLPGDMEETATRKLFAQWQPLAAAAHWNLAIPLIAGLSDPAVQAAEGVLSAAKKQLPGLDENRVYLVGQGASTAEVFYTLSRAPDLWAAVLAIQGSAGPAINSFRLFGANTWNTPLLWIAAAPEVDLYRHKLSAADFRFETQPEANVQQVFEWLAKHRRAPFPLTVDCETGSPAFARCFWIEMTKFDPKLRNDVLKSTRVLPGSGASIAIGPFGFDPLAAGPGAVVGMLPKNYQGPLRLNDRIVMLAGKEVRDGREYSQMMDDIKEEKSVAILVQRGKERTRMETKIVLPKREETITARIEGRYTPDQKELLLIGRAVTQARVTIPPDWPPLSVSWNGLDFPKLESAGCWLLSIEKDPPQATKCP